MTVILDRRRSALAEWLGSVLGLAHRPELEVVSGDASFRRYFRYRDGETTWIAVDAPPDRENSRPFVAVARALSNAGVACPQVRSADLDQGFMCLSDLGDRLLLPALNATSVDGLYRSAIVMLAQMQQITDVPGYALPPYDVQRLRVEMGLFPDWFLQRHLQITFSEAERKLWASLQEKLVASACEQPQVFVHRDFHSRNIMLGAQGALATIDFQDAVRGPITYDLVSLIKDCYVQWPKEQRAIWVSSFTEACLPSGLAVERVQRWVDWMGLQRHLKVLGIFARLNYRDGKASYLRDLPLTMDYVLEVVDIYPECADFADFMHSRVVPAFAKASAA